MKAMDASQKYSEVKGSVTFNSDIVYQFLSKVFRNITIF